MKYGITVPVGYWADADDFDSDDWCFATMEGTTTLPYWEWVAHQRDQHDEQALEQSCIDGEV